MILIIYINHIEKRLSGIIPGSLRCMVEYLDGLFEWIYYRESVPAYGLYRVNDIQTAVLRYPDLGTCLDDQFLRWITVIEERCSVLPHGTFR